MYCKHCKKPNGVNDKFCKSCGTKIKNINNHLSRATVFLRKIVRNKYLWIFAGVIFVLWVASSDNTSSTNGTKIPLPYPTPINKIQPIAFQPTNLPDKLDCIQINTLTGKAENVDCDLLKSNPPQPIKKECGPLTTILRPDYCIWASKTDESFTSTTTEYQQFLKERQAGLTVPYSLDNGYVLKQKASGYFDGDGQLLIKNGTSYDAVAKLIRNGTSVFTVYIKAQSNYSITKISDGTYWLAFMQGTDWDTTNRTFVRNTSYQSFDDTFDFTTTEDDQYVHYSKFTITLNPVVGGTAETTHVDPSQFNAY